MKILLEQELQTIVLQEPVTLEQILKLLHQQDILLLQEVTQTDTITPTQEVILVLTTDPIPTVITTEVTQTLIIESLVPITTILITDLTVVLERITEVTVITIEVIPILTIEVAVDLTTDHPLVQVDRLLRLQEAILRPQGQVADLHLVASTEAALRDLRQGLPDRHPVLQEVPEVEDNEHTVF